MKQSKNIFLGLILVAVGFLWGLNALGITRIDITLIDGWWTLFIIIPSLIGLFTQRNKTSNLIWLWIGIALFMCCRGVLNFHLVWKLALPVILIIWGLSCIFSDVFHKAVGENIKKLSGHTPAGTEYCATFSSQAVDFSGEKFYGASLTSVFGGIKCDLRKAVISEDLLIHCCVIFGGIDIYVPDDVKVKIRSTSIFGGVSDKGEHSSDLDAKTIYIDAGCLFGGVDIK